MVQVQVCEYSRLVVYIYIYLVLLMSINAGIEFTTEFLFSGVYTYKHGIGRCRTPIHALMPSSVETRAHIYNRHRDVQVQRSLNNWYTGCGFVDSRVVLYLVYALFSLLVVVFCMVQLSTLVACHPQQMYSSMLTLVLGVYLPNPHQMYRRRPQNT